MVIQAEVPLQLLKIRMQRFPVTTTTIMASVAAAAAAAVVMVLVVLGMAVNSGQLVGETDNSRGVQNSARKEKPWVVSLKFAMTLLLATLRI